MQEEAGLACLPPKLAGGSGCGGGRGCREVPLGLPVTGPRSLQEEAKAKEEEGVPDEEGWVKVTRRGRRPVLPRTEAASLRVLEREKHAIGRSWQKSDDVTSHMA